MYEYQTEKTISGLFFTMAEKHKKDPFLVAKFDKGVPTDKWIPQTWAEVATEAKNFGAGLIELGIEKGDRVGIFAHDRPRWVIADQGIQGAGGWGVPMYPTSTDEQLAYILKDCGAKAIVVGDERLMKQAVAVKPKAPELKYIIVMTPVQDPPDPSVLNFDAVVEKGAKSAKAQDEFDKRRKALTSEDVISIIYTSGTTGEPKGAVLTQRNFTHAVVVLLENTLVKKMISRGIRLISLCHLPLCHIFGRTSDYHVQIAMAGQIWFAESYQKVPINLLEVRPQMLITIPRLYEKVYEIVQTQGAKLTGIQKKIYDWAFKVGSRVVDHLSEGKRLPFPLAVQFSFATTLVFSKIKKMAGLDRLVFAGSGGGALSADTNRFFRAMNIQVAEGYGLTETTSAITWNSFEFLKPMPDKWIYRKALDWLVDTMVVMVKEGTNPFGHPVGMLKMTVVSNLILPLLIQKPGSVGRPCKDTDIKIAEDGEILVRGPQVFQKNLAYYKRAELNPETFTENGWFRTGDIGYFDKDGFVVITDRKKELLVTAGGKNVAPHPIELALCQDTFIDQACVIGDAKKYIAALLVPQFELLEKWAKDKGIKYSSRSELVKHPEVAKLYEEKVEKVNQKLARYEQVKKFSLLPVVFSEETSELTPTLKLKRRVIYKKFAKDIESCY